MSFDPSRIFPHIVTTISPALPPFSEVKRVFGPEDEATALVSVLTPQGMKPLLKVTLSASSAGTQWAEPFTSRLAGANRWFDDHWAFWESVQKDVGNRINIVASAVWACQPVNK